MPLELPSGAKILARRPEPSELGRLGLLLNTLESTARATLKGRALELAETWGFMQVARELLLCCYAEPKISVTPRAGEIHPREVPFEDVRFVLWWALRSGPRKAGLTEFTDFDRGLLHAFRINADAEQRDAKRGLQNAD